jgi:signal transduction histidine kinase/CheY-like chemotaxis protein
MGHQDGGADGDGRKVWALRRWNPLPAAWTLVIGLIVQVLMVVAWAQIPAALYLLIVPSGLAVLGIGSVGSTIIALLCTGVLLFVPSPPLPPDSVLRFVTLIGIWTVVGFTRLTLGPLLTAMEWSWSSCEESRRLLEQAREYQEQLNQTVADLADANLQLIRLNRLTQGLRQEAEDARRAKEQFVANVSHELRTPLNMIIGFSEMVVRAPHIYGGNIPKTLLADLDVVRRNSQHLSSLIDDVLDLSQIEAGRVSLTKERVALCEVIESAVTAVRPLYESKGLLLRTEVVQGLPLVMCDLTRIRAVLLNLLSNAGRFTERGGVKVCAWQEGSEVVVSVTDSGPGIADSEKEKLFQPFQQLDGSIRRRYGGSGLGLAISRSFVELHGGRMWLESKKGVGTTFYFRLPIDPPAPMESSPARWISPSWRHEEPIRHSLAPKITARPRLVVLESSDSLQRLLKRFLDGTEIQPVADLDQAVQEITRVPTQALIINDVSVSEALHRLSRSAGLPNGTPAIICSVPGEREAAHALGVSDYLVKPIVRETLLGALERLHVRSGTILIVDDEPDALRMFQRMLTSAGRGYQVLRASDGQQALDILREQQPDAILLDLVMQGMDGFHLLEVRSRDPVLCRIPVVIISARDPAGQPIVSNAVAATCGGGLSVPQLLSCIQALSAILSPIGQVADQAPSETPTG